MISTSGENKSLDLLFMLFSRKKSHAIFKGLFYGQPPNPALPTYLVSLAKCQKENGNGGSYTRKSKKHTKKGQFL